MTDDAGLQINAWIDSETGPVVGEPSPALRDWAIRRSGAPIPGKVLFADEEADPRDWRNSRVGWGLVLPDNDAVEAQDKAAAKDAPEAIQRLLAARPGSPVLRYRPDLGVAHLRRYDGKERDLATAGGERGTGLNEIPQYLLIVGSPSQIPWRLQYVLNPNYFVGRLDLAEDGLRSYVDALLADWEGYRASRRKVLIWTVDKGSQDITWLMRHGLAEPLRKEFATDKDQTVQNLTHLAEAEATHRNLTAALSRDAPGLVVTTSHGATPIHLPAQELRAALGRLVDQQGEYLLDEALAEWQPDGAIWYAHACCSAGADASTVYTDVADPASDVHRVLIGVTAAGACTAPLPRYLLGCDRPLRAFVGHVEPTFNWTLRDRSTGQLLTSSLRKALYNGLYRQQGEPIGLALHRCYAEVGGLWARWDVHRGEAAGGDYAARDRALEPRMAALDRQSTVILGDPTVTVAQD